MACCRNADDPPITTNARTLCCPLKRLLVLNMVILEFLALCTVSGDETLVDERRGDIHWFGEICGLYAVQRFLLMLLSSSELIGSQIENIS